MVDSSRTTAANVEGWARLTARLRPSPTSTAVWRDVLADDATFDRWYEQTMPRVFGFVMSRCGHDRDVAEEVTQRTFLAAVEQRWRFDGRSDLTTWLCGIARHKLADHYRTAEREQRRRIRAQVREIPGVVSGDAERAEDREVIAAAFRSLPPAQKAVLAFAVVDGLSVPETARLIGKSRLATQSLLHRARESFRRAYEREIRP